MLLLTRHPSRAVCHLLIIPKRSLYSFCCDVRREGGRSTWRWPRMAARGVGSDPTCWPCVLSLFSYPVGAVCLLIWWIGNYSSFHRCWRPQQCTCVYLLCGEHSPSLPRLEHESAFPKMRGRLKSADFVRMVPKGWGLFHIQFIYTVLVRAWHPRIITNRAPFYSQRLPIGTSQLMVTCW